MSGLSSLVIAESDPLVREAVRFAFEREGVEVAAADSVSKVNELLEAAGRQLVIVGCEFSGKPGLALLQWLRAGWQEGNGAVPLLYLGDLQTHSEAMAAGATQCLPRPSYVRDVVTVARLLANRKRQGGPPTFVGELGDLYGLYYVVRALSVVRWRGVLNIVRGLRRGELRFFDGEVTSAQVGVLHGLAALHQLLLWTEARLELRVEDVVRRCQIPLAPDEVLTDAERFLSEIRTEAGTLSPSIVFQQDGQRAGELPKQVLPVLRLFDGARTVADVIEDSPYRVFETLRASARLAELGFIHKIKQPARSGARAALAIEEWLVGAAPVPEQQPRLDSEPVGPEPGEPASPPAQRQRTSKKRRKNKRKQQRAVVSRAPATDWTQLLPSVMANDLPGYAAVVPSVSAGGEIRVERERLEELTDAAERSKLFGGAISSEAVPLTERAAAVEEIARDDAIVSEPQAETQRALHALPIPDEEPNPDERFREESAEALHTAHDAAAAVEMALQAVRSAPHSGSNVAEAAASAVDAGDTEVVERVAPEELEVTSGELVSGKVELPSYLASAPEQSIVVDEAAPVATPTETAPEPPPVQYVPVAPAPAPQPATLGPTAVRPEQIDRLSRYPRAATPAPHFDADAARLAAETAQAAEAVAVFTTQEEEFFRAGHELQVEAPTPLESFDDLETAPPKTFWQRLVSRPEVKEVETGPVPKTGTPKKKV